MQLLACLLPLAAHAHTDHDDEGLHLLQLKAQVMTSSHTDRSILDGSVPDSANGRSCWLWGDPHLEACHVPGGKCSPHGSAGDPHQLGLLPMTESKDGRIKMQMYQLYWANGISFMAMIGIEIDGHTIVLRPPLPEEAEKDKLNRVSIMIDGEEFYATTQDFNYPDAIPGTPIKLERHVGKAKNAATANNHCLYVRHPDVWFMVCADGNGGNQNYNFWMNAGMEYLNPDIIPDPSADLLCTKGKDASQLDFSRSIFSNDDHDRVCTYAGGPLQTDPGWYGKSQGRYFQDRGEAIPSCDKPPPPPPKPPVQDMCKNSGCDWDHAQRLCSKLKKQEDLYSGCLEDYCTSCDVVAVAGAEEVSNEENEDPVCSDNSPQCDPEEACASSVKMNTMTVTQNNLGGVGPDTGPEELRYGNAAEIDGRMVDLVVSANGKFPAHKASKNGVQGAFGVINMKCRHSVELDFQALDAETGEAVNLDMVTISWYDLDEGKKGKGRSSVSVCGATGAIVSSNSELTLDKAGGCDTATSSTPGTGKDNPTDPATLDPVQRARAVSFPLTNTKTITASLSIEKGSGGRNFMFAIQPSLACPANFGVA